MDLGLQVINSYGGASFLPDMNHVDAAEFNRRFTLSNGLLYPAVRRGASAVLPVNLTSRNAVWCRRSDLFPLAVE